MIGAIFDIEMHQTAIIADLLFCHSSAKMHFFNAAAEKLLKQHTQKEAFYLSRQMRPICSIWMTFKSTAGFHC
jgi:hypothetical protein